MTGIDGGRLQGRLRSCGDTGAPLGSNCAGIWGKALRAERTVKTNALRPGGARLVQEIASVT